MSESVAKPNARKPTLRQRLAQRFGHSLTLPRGREGDTTPMRIQFLVVRYLLALLLVLYVALMLDEYQARQPHA